MRYWKVESWKNSVEKIIDRFKYIVFNMYINEEANLFSSSYWSVIESYQEIIKAMKVNNPQERVAFTAFFID